MVFVERLASQEGPLYYNQAEKAALDTQCQSSTSTGENRISASNNYTQGNVTCHIPAISYMTKSVSIPSET